MSKQADGGRDGSDGVDLAIESLCIFSTELGQQEGREKDKVLFYYPTETDVYRQTRNAGLAAAMVGFTGQFSPEQPVEAVVTQKTIQSFYCCEEGCRVPHSQVPGKRPSVWLVLTVRKGAALRPAAGGSSSSKGKAAAPLPPETEGGADDRVLRVHELARLCWQTFTMFHCSAESIIQRAGTMVDPPLTKADIKAGIDGWAPVREALGGFMPAYLPGVRFGSVLGGDHQRPPTPDVLTTLGGVHFLAVDKQSYLRIQLMINALEMRFPGIVATVLMHGTDLVSSGLDTAPTQLLYAFLSHHVLGRGAGDGAAGGRAAAAAAWAHTVTVMSTADDLPSSSAASGGAARRTPSPPRPIYLPGPVGRVHALEPEPEPGVGAGGGDVDDPAAVDRHPERSKRRYHLLVYHQPPATLALVFDHEDAAAGDSGEATEPPAPVLGSPTLPDLGEFEHFLRPMLEQELVTLGMAIGRAAAGGVGAAGELGGAGISSSSASRSGRGSTQSRADGDFRFVYLNRLNLAVKVSSGFTHPDGTSLLTPEFQRQLGSMHLEFSRPDGATEVCAKTAADHWIIGRRCGEREFFMLLDQKQFSLAAANEEIERLCRTFFGNIFLFG